MTDSLGPIGPLSPKPFKKSPSSQPGETEPLKIFKGANEKGSYGSFSSNSTGTSTPKELTPINRRPTEGSDPGSPTSEAHVVDDVVQRYLNLESNEANGSFSNPKVAISILKETALDDEIAGLFIHQSPEDQKALCLELLKEGNKDLIKKYESILLKPQENDTRDFFEVEKKLLFNLHPEMYAKVLMAVPSDKILSALSSLVSELPHFQEQIERLITDKLPTVDLDDFTTFISNPSNQKPELFTEDFLNILEEAFGQDVTFKTCDYVFNQKQPESFTPFLEKIQKLDQDRKDTAARFMTDKVDPDYKLAFEGLKLGSPDFIPFSEKVEVAKKILALSKKDSRAQQDPSLRITRQDLPSDLKTAPQLLAVSLSTAFSFQETIDSLWAKFKSLFFTFKEPASLAGKITTPDQALARKTAKAAMKELSPVKGLLTKLRKANNLFFESNTDTKVLQAIAQANQKDLKSIVSFLSEQNKTLFFASLKGVLSEKTQSSSFDPIFSNLSQKDKTEFLESLTVPSLNEEAKKTLANTLQNLPKFEEKQSLIKKFETSLFTNYKKDLPFRVRDEALCLKNFHNDLVADYKNKMPGKDKLLKALSILALGPNYQAFPKEILKTCSKEDLAQALSSIKDIPEKSRESLLSNDFLEIALTNFGEESVNTLYETLYSSFGNKFPGQYLEKIKLLDQKQKDQAALFMLSKKETDPKMAFEGLKLIDPTFESAKQIDTAKFLMFSTKSDLKPIYKSDLPIHLQMDSRLDEKPLEQLEKTATLYDQILAKTSALKEELERLTKRSDEFKEGEYSALVGGRVIYPSNPLWNQTKSQLATQIASLQKELNTPLLEKLTSELDPLSPPEKQEAVYQLSDFNSSAYENFIASKEFKDNFSDYIAALTVSYGKDFFQRVVMVKNVLGQSIFENIGARDSFNENYDGIRLCPSQKKWIDSLKPFLAEDVDLTLALFEKKCLSQKDLLEIAVKDKNARFETHKELISKFNDEHLRRFIKFKLWDEIGTTGSRQINGYLLSSLDTKGLKEAVKLLNATDHGKAYFFAKDLLNKKLFEEKSKDLVSLAFYEGHLNEMLVDTLKSEEKVALIEKLETQRKTLSFNTEINAAIEKIRFQS
jgi:hypothetical protein